MAIHVSNKVESNSGFEKVIDDASMHMALDVLQKFQYQFPQKSTVRELVANAIDSHKERDIAKLILSGKAKVEDYYVESSSSDTKASAFNEDYFNLNNLSSVKEVEIIYEEGNLRDKLIVKDYGVGLGGSRLEGYFKLNWSSKRLSKSTIGKFGLGSKSPLSTGVDSFRVTTVHNGKKFAFDVYSHKVDSVTEKFSSTGTINPTQVFENGYECYYETTNELNGTTIEVEVKKHHKSMYMEAVRSQLLYMDNVKFKIISNGYEQSIDTKATVIYEDADIILSDNTQYSKPHIIINNVCYGPINFLELELDNKNGNIGIKMDAENIDISPSRESVIFADRTREEVTNKFKRVQEIASAEVQKQLTEKDFGKWLSKCANVLSYGTSSNDVLGRLSRVIDRSSLKPEFSDTGIKYKVPSELLYGVQIREVRNSINYNYRTDKTTSSITREDISNWTSINNGLYYTTGSASNTKDKYLTSLNSDFVLLTLPVMGDEEEFKGQLEANNKVSSAIQTNPDIEWLNYKAKREKQQAIIDLLLSSKLAVNYDELEVPELFLKRIEESEKEVDEGEDAQTVELTPAEKRKLEEKIVCYYPKYENYVQTKNKSDGTSYNTIFSWVKHEPKLSEVKDWKNVIYCYSDEDEQLLTTAFILQTQSGNDYNTKDIKLIRIAKGLKKHFKQFTHVSEFYKNLIGTTAVDKNNKLVKYELIMHNLFTKWYTGKLINDQLVGYKFLANFSAFNQEIADKYAELNTYEVTNYKDMGSYYKSNLLGCNDEAFSAITTFAEKVMTLQLAVVNKQDNITELSTTLFNEEFTDAYAIDVDMYNKLQEVIEYAKPLQGILSYMPILTSTTPIKYELESEIKEIMRNKGYEV